MRSAIKIIVRQETNADFSRVREIVKNAFLHAEFTDHDEHNLVERLRNSEGFIPELSLVAVVDDEIVGHILFTKIAINDGITRVTSLALAPVSVIPELQGKGIGKKLVEKGHEIAKTLGFNSVIVLGHSTYYPRFGYLAASHFGIAAPFYTPDDAFMAIEIKDQGLANVKGLVEYPEAFFE